MTLKSLISAFVFFCMTLKSLIPAFDTITDYKQTLLF